MVLQQLYVFSACITLYIYSIFVQDDDGKQAAIRYGEREKMIEYPLTSLSFSLPCLYSIYICDLRAIYMRIAGTKDSSSSSFAPSLVV